MPVALLSNQQAAPLLAAQLTYREVGQTATHLPPRYRHMRRARCVGFGPSVFAAAADAVLTWRIHENAGLHVTASAVAAKPGVVVLLGIRIGSARFTAPCRVVYAIDEPGRCGFAYGTLPGHPESGEEAFGVSLLGDGRVIATITAFSRPATTAARMAGPVAALVQQRVTTRYLRAFTAVAQA